MGGGGSPFGQPQGKPSPFEADKARKGREDLSSGTEIPAVAVAPAPVNLASQPAPFAGRPAVPPLQAGNAPFGTPFGTPFSTPLSTAQDNGSALAVAPQMESAGTAPGATPNQAVLDVDALRETVLQAMETGGSQMLVHALEEGHWTGDGNLLSVQVEMSQAMIELSYTREQEKLANVAASRVAGRAVKVRLVGGASAAAEAKPRRASNGSAAASGSMKTRAAEEPIVKRMMEKFGAEIRIVMDRSER